MWGQLFTMWCSTLKWTTIGQTGNCSRCVSLVWRICTSISTCCYYINTLDFNTLFWGYVHLCLTRTCSTASTLKLWKYEVIFWFSAHHFLCFYDRMTIFNYTGISLSDKFGCFSICAFAQNKNCLTPLLSESHISSNWQGERKSFSFLSNGHALRRD